MLKAIRNHILFQFTDEFVQGQFLETTEWGFALGKQFDNSAKHARFGLVITTGHECMEEIQPGMTIMIDNLKWSNGFEYEGVKYWRTDDSHVLGIQEAQ